jgi:hypothetical protein
MKRMNYVAILVLIMLTVDLQSRISVSMNSFRQILVSCTCCARGVHSGGGVC